jgi:hypothetical protein
MFQSAPSRCHREKAKAGPEWFPQWKSLSQSRSAKIEKFNQYYFFIAHFKKNSKDLLPTLVPPFCSDAKP